MYNNRKNSNNNGSYKNRTNFNSKASRKEQEYAKFTAPKKPRSNDEIKNKRLSNESNWQVKKPIDNTSLYIGNPYGIRVQMMKKIKVGNDIEDIVPYEGVPFYVVLRGHLKTIYSIVCDLILSAKLSGEIIKDKNDEPVKVDRTMSSEEVREALMTPSQIKAFDEFEQSVNYSKIDRFMEIPGGEDTSSMMMFYDIEGHVCSWHSLKNEKSYAPNTKEYTIIAKDSFDMMFDFCNKYIAEEKGFEMSLHQRAAWFYMVCVKNGTMIRQ